MATHIIVVENRSDWKAQFPEVTVIPVKDYLAQQDYLKEKDVRVINLCRNYRYSSVAIIARCSRKGVITRSFHRSVPFSISAASRSTVSTRGSRRARAEEPDQKSRHAGR